MGLLDFSTYNPAPSQPAQQPTQPTAQPQPAPQDAQAGLLSPEEQTAKFGGPVGSPAYNDYVARQADVSARIEKGPFAGVTARDIGSAMGMKLPDQQTWDAMDTGSKIKTAASAAGATAIDLIKGLPRQIVKAPISVVNSIVAPTWQQIRTGKAPTFESLANDKRLELPWLGQVPTYYQSYDDARKSGLGPKASLLMAGNQALGDITIGADLAESVAKGFQPRAQVNGVPILDTKPIQSALQGEKATMALRRRPEGSLNEYYSLPKSVTSKYGGHPANTFLKVSPADIAGGAVDVSVVQTRGGMLQRAADFLKGRGENVYRGDFGPETTIEKKTIPVGNGEVPTSAVGEPERIKILGQIMPKALKGLEDKPMTSDQLTHLGDITKANGIDPAVADSVVKSVTGKDSVGQMTQADYVKASQTLGTMNRMSSVAEGPPKLNPVTSWMSPMRKVMASYEEQSGGRLPLNTEAYTPMQNAKQSMRTFVDPLTQEKNDIFGKYNGPKFAEERRVLMHYMQGDTTAITANDALSTQTKADLIGISGKLREWYNKTGPLLGIEPEYFLKDYQPHIQNRGGIFQLYKDGKGIPKEMSFFAEKKRVGSTNIQVDDASALADIYLRSGANKLFMNPALERINNLAATLPENVKPLLRSFVGESLGYADKLSEHLDGMVPDLNRKLGLNLPADLSRQMTHMVMDTTNSAGIGFKPGVMLKQLFQLPLQSYPRLGPRFYAEGIAKAMTSEGRAELISRGLNVPLGVPYGEALTKDITLGGQIGKAYQGVTQASLNPHAQIDLFNRAATFWQGKGIWDDAFNKYKTGKLSYGQLEDAIDLKAFAPSDRNIIRQALISGDEAGAFNHFIRDIIDNVHSPYRRGTSAQATFGLTGKLLTQFGQRNIDYAHLLGGWARSGQWDKLIRFHGAMTAVRRSMNDTVGVDPTRWTGLNALSTSLSPFVQFASQVLDGVNNWKNNNKALLNANWKAISNQVKYLGVPAGLQLQNTANFLKSTKAGPIGPDGTFPVYSKSTGKLDHFSDFSDLFWSTLGGLPMSTDEARNGLVKEMRNANADYVEAKRKTLELYQQGKTDQAATLIQQYGIKLTPGDFDQYHIPYSQQIFKSLPPLLKAEFAPRLFQPK